MLEFIPFSLEHKPIIEQYIKPHGFSCSEFTFTNMIIWGQDGKIQWAQKDDVLYVRLQFGAQAAPFMFPPIPKSFDQDYRQALDAAIAYFFKTGAQPRFRSVSGDFVARFEACMPQFSLVPDRNTFDYMYNAKDLITLSGRKLHAKRNHIHQFTSQYTFEYRPLTSHMQEECLALYMSWLGEKDIYQPGILGEMKAIQFLLPNMEKLGVLGGSIYINGKMAAFSLGEQINHNTAVIHIEKADASYIGLYALINQQFAQHTWSKMEFINREEDMGIPGMRKAKLSYRPVRLIEKFDAVLRP